MGEYEVDNVNGQQELAENDSYSLWIWTTIVLTATTIGLGVKNFFTSRKLKQEREKNALYQKALKMHQAEIDELKSEKARREYRDRLWAEIQAELEE